MNSFLEAHPKKFMVDSVSGVVVKAFGFQGLRTQDRIRDALLRSLALRVLLSSVRFSEDGLYLLRGSLTSKSPNLSL